MSETRARRAVAGRTGRLALASLALLLATSGAHSGAAQSATVATATAPADATAASASRDVRTFGATCDGTSDTTAAFQAAYDALTRNGGEIVVPAGVACAIGGDGVAPRANVALRCEKGARLVALPGARALFRTTQTIDDWSVSGCTFDLNGTAAVAWESSGAEKGGARWSFRDNVVRGCSTDAGAPLSLVRLDCTLASGPCVIAGNTIFGSESRARGDTCLTVTAGGFVGFNTQILGNWIQGCGADCLEVRHPGGVTANDNVLVRCLDEAVDNSSLNSVWTGNQLVTSGSEAGASMRIHDTIGNQVIVGNQFAVNPRTSAPAVHAVAGAKARLAGIYLDDNYAAQGVWFDAKGACSGGTCGGESCDDDAGCGACGGRCTDHGVFDHDHVANLIVTGDIRIESATNVIVQGNVVIGNAGPGAPSQILFTNPRADVPSGGIVVSDNQLSKRTAASSSLACIELDDAGGGGFAGVTITGNACGQDPAIAPGGRPHGVRLTRTPRVWRSVLIADNNFANTKEALVGFAEPAVRAATRLSGNLGLDAGAAQPVVESFAVAGAVAVKTFAAVALASDADVAVIPAARGTAAVGCALDGGQPGESVAVAVGGIADCLVALGIGERIARGDALAISTEAGHLAKAKDGATIIGRALAATEATGPLRVLIQPSASTSKGGASLPVARVTHDVVRAESDAPVADPALVLPLAAGQSYALDGHLRVRAADAATGFAALLEAPAGTTASVLLRGTPAGERGALLAATDTAPVVLPLAVGDNVIAVSGSVSTTAEGTLELRWAQGARGPAPLVLQTGSWLRATELP